MSNITLSKTKGSILDSIGRRIYKIFEIGAKTAKECAPFGIDSSVPDEFTAIFAKTSNIGESVVIGYIQRNQLAAVGETRMFSLDPDGNLSAFVWAKNDGSLQLNGDAFTAVRFAALQTALNAEVQLINVELGKIAAGIATAGGSYVVTPITLDISAAESPDVKLK